MSIVLNVIYTPQTATRLSFFAWSLLRWPDVRLRLVANGCSQEERQYLRAFSAADPRLDYFELPTDTMWLHSKVLDYLLSVAQEEIFGFIDSDIFVVEPAGRLSLPDGCAAAFSCPKPVWRPEARPKPVGCTYAALYRRDVIVPQIEATGIGFGKYTWESIPLAIQRDVDEAGFREPKYDTGQVLNILLVARGHRVGNIEDSRLRHVGNYSAVIEPGPGARALGMRGGKHGPRWWLGPLVRGQVKSIGSYLYRMRGKKEGVNRYLNQLLDALHNGQRVPRVPWYFPQPIRDQVKTLTADIATLYSEFRRSRFYANLERQRSS